MLQQICEHIHNYFIKSVHEGDFVIADDMISLPFMKDGQRFLIVGSDLNDGVYTYHSGLINDDDDSAAAGLSDESFSGRICVMAVPPQIIALTAEIQSWVVKYADVINSPYQSENVIGVYSYTKAGNGRDASGNEKPVTWQTVFADQLNRWRKVAF